MTVAGDFIRKFSKQLVVVSRLYISSMVLVEVGQPIIHKYIANEVPIQREANFALTRVAFAILIDPDVFRA